MTTFYTFQLQTKMADMSPRPPDVAKWNQNIYNLSRCSSEQGEETLLGYRLGHTPSNSMSCCHLNYLVDAGCTLIIFQITTS